MDEKTNSPFVITPSKNGECFTITTSIKSSWEVISKLLKEKYTFQLNVNGNLTTAINTEGQKVVLTLFQSSRKLLIQGLGCKV